MSPPPPSSSPSHPSRRAVLSGLGATAAAAALPGCGPETSDRSSAALSFWQFFAPRGASAAQNEWFDRLVTQWNQNNEAQVRLQFVPNSQYVGGPKLQTAFSAEDGPDVFVVSPGDFLRYSNGGVLEDLSPHMTPEAREDFYPDLLASRAVDEAIYALPMGGGPMAMYYSVPAFEQAGLSEGDIPATWDQLLDVADKLTTDEQFGLVVDTSPTYYQNFTFYPFLWMAGGGIPGHQNPQGDFDSQGAIAALTLWQEMIESGVAPRTLLGESGSDIVSNLGSGYCAMQNAGMWGVSALAAGSPDLEYGVFRLPVPDDGEYVTATGGWAFAANARGRDPDAAARFCVWALGSMDEESIGRVASWCLEAQSYLPYRRSATEHATQQGFFDDGPMRTFRDEIFPGALGEPRLPSEMNKLISDAIQACQLTGKDPTEVAGTAQEGMENLLAAYDGAPLT